MTSYDLPPQTKQRLTYGPGARNRPQPNSMQKFLRGHIIKGDPSRSGVALRSCRRAQFRVGPRLRSAWEHQGQPRIPFGALPRHLSIEGLRRNQRQYQNTIRGMGYLIQTTEHGMIHPWFP